MFFSISALRLVLLYYSLLLIYQHISFFHIFCLFRCRVIATAVELLGYYFYLFTLTRNNISTSFCCCVFFFAYKKFRAIFVFRIIMIKIIIVFKNCLDFLLTVSSRYCVEFFSLLTWRKVLP